MDATIREELQPEKVYIKNVVCIETTPTYMSGQQALGVSVYTEVGKPPVAYEITSRLHIMCGCICSSSKAMPNSTRYSFLSSVRVYGYSSGTLVIAAED